MGKHILITSITSWNQRSGSNTFSTLFERFDSADLANLYVRPEIPDSPVCSRYFNIREWLVVRSIFKRGTSTGLEVKRQEYSSVNDLSKEQNKDRFFSKNRKRIYLWLREIAWLLGKWKSKELDDFLKDFKPEVLFFPIESYPYFNRINEYIIKCCKPKKVIGYLWDDNFTYKQHPYNIFHRIERYFLRKQVRALVANCTNVLAISPKMKEECDREFGIDSILLTKPICEQSEFVPYIPGDPIRMLYTGKLIIGRDKTIVEVVKAIQKVNANGQKVILDIYTNTELSKNMKQKIEIPGCCQLHAPVSQQDVLKLQKDADILLFVESMSNRDLTARLSFSTKLTDYFSAGKCIWAIGNRDLGPISYIESEKAGLVSWDKESIERVLSSMAENPTLVTEYAKCAADCGKKNHDKGIIEERLMDIMR